MPVFSVRVGDVDEDVGDEWKTGSDLVIEVVHGARELFDVQVRRRMHFREDDDLLGACVDGAEGQHFFDCRVLTDECVEVIELLGRKGSSDQKVGQRSCYTERGRGEQEPDQQ